MAKKYEINGGWRYKDLFGITGNTYGINLYLNKKFKINDA